ncbi:MAG: glycogen debranching protein GlgX [Candidatus Omnitrophica bacterium]|nr:glycogen debranching protein GlgX [Candidatus Omnitrophota bacterium]
MGYKLAHRTDKRTSAGSGKNLGAVVSDRGVNFAIFSGYATEIFLLLFDPGEKYPSDILRLERSAHNIWHIFVYGLKAGQLYGYKVRGEYDPKEGMRFNENKLLIDPYAKAFEGDFLNEDDLLLGYENKGNDRDLSFDKRDNTHIVPRSVVVDDSFDWQNVAKPDIPLEKYIIYEVHVKGFTAHPSSRVRSPGTYPGFTEKIQYLKELGVNAVEFLPIHQFYKRDGLVKTGLSDYWGYNSLGYFAPEKSYARDRGGAAAVAEFKTLVRELHKAGIEVILDVVYNHTGEGSELGPTLCLRGIDNPSYYALRGYENNPYRFYINDTGCGNTLNLENPAAMRLVLDSLRYWTEEMRVDGFRFDLASVLARVKGQYSKDSGFFKAVASDPVLKNVKLIAEPWDLTTYAVGNFPPEWAEWNDKFRDNMRKFFKGYPHQAKELAFRLTGSADLYGDDLRTPYHSVNFITCHDGFTLNDLYSYERKHNEANGEENRDGAHENYSWNAGVEGETHDEMVLALRKKLVKNALVSVLIPLGTPMLLGGDEFMRTQKGNNNAYCQDNEISWFDWDRAGKNKDVIEFTKDLIKFRKKYTVLQKRKFMPGQPLDFDKLSDIAWFGEKLDKINWESHKIKTFCCYLNGGAAPSELGDYRLFFIININNIESIVKIPRLKGKRWYRVLDTSLPGKEVVPDPGPEDELSSSDIYRINPISVVGLLAI